MIGRESADTEDDLLEGGDVGARRSPIALQQRERLQRTNHLSGSRVRDRCNAHGDVLQKFRDRATRAARDDRPEDIVMRDTNEHLHDPMPGR